MKITRVVATTVDVPLPKPIVMGELRFDSREYVLVRIETDGGSGPSGIGFGMTRGAPVAEIVARNLAPLLLDADPLMTEDLWERLYYRNLTIAGRGIFMRALSAVDIALWDIKGHAAGMPVWQLLGGARSRVPVSVAGAYVRDGTTLDELRAEIADYVERGYALIKIAAGELLADGERLRVANEVIGGRAELAYDAHWAWRSLYDVVPVLKRWSDLPIAFIEDPFAPELVGLAPQLRADTGFRIGLGEDAVGRWAFLSLLADLEPDLLRIDATTMGGLSEAARVCGLASMHARPVIPHVFPEVHQHLGFAFPIVRAVEITQPEYELETLYRLFRAWVTIDKGLLVAPTSPGLGMELDPAAVKRHTIREFDIEA
jgi:L-alanine-DL-glutamate epimerase-like enolase superfamily enzyme